MAHCFPGEAAHNDVMPHDEWIPHEGMTPAPHGSMPMADAPTTVEPLSDATITIDTGSPDAKPAHSTTPHSH